MNTLFDSQCATSAARSPLGLALWSAIACLSPIANAVHDFEFLSDIHAEVDALGFSDSNVELIGDFAAGFLMTASTSSYGRELWYSDGTKDGTRLLFDSWIGIEGGLNLPDFLARSDGSYIGPIHTNSWGSELFRLNPARLKAELVLDAYPGPFGAMALSPEPPGRGL